MKWCKECRVYHFNNNECLPCYDVHAPEWHGDDMEEHARVRSVDEESAACKWAEAHDADGDYTIIGGTPEMVAVRRTGGGGSWQWFRVSGESVPEYHACETNGPEGHL